MVSCGTPTPQRNRFVGAVLHLDDGQHWKVIGCNTRRLDGEATYTIENAAGRRRVIAKSVVTRLARSSPEDVEGGIPYTPYPPRQIPRGVPIAARTIPLRVLAHGYAPFLKRAKTQGRRVILDGEGRLCNLQGVPYQPHTDECDPVTGRTRTRSGRFKKGCGPRTPRPRRASGEPGSIAEWNDPDDWRAPPPPPPPRPRPYAPNDAEDDAFRELEERQRLRDERLARTSDVHPDYRAAYQRAVREDRDVMIDDRGIPRFSMTGDALPI